MNINGFNLIGNQHGARSLSIAGSESCLKSNEVPQSAETTLQTTAGGGGIRTIGSRGRAGSRDPGIEGGDDPEGLLPIGSEELNQLVGKYYQYGIKTFGAKRCMFESNFPMDRENVSYNVLWNMFKRVACDLALSPQEKRDVFANTAIRVYKLTNLKA